MDREEILQSHLAKGERANRAYENYVKELIDDYKQQILSGFITISPDSNDLLTLKHRLDFIISFENQIKADINNGTLARQELQV
jgi:hypothetical protein